MKITIYKKQKNQAIKVTTWELDRYVEKHIRKSSNSKIVKLRKAVNQMNGEDCYSNYADIEQIGRIYTSGSFNLDGNGNMVFEELSGLVSLTFRCQSGLEAVNAFKEKAQMLTSTVAAFLGADGRSLNVLVGYTDMGGKLPTAESEAETIYRKAWLTAASLYSSVMGCEAVGENPSIRNSIVVTIDSDAYLNVGAKPLRIDVGESDDEVRLNDGKFQTPEVKKSYTEWSLLYRNAVKEVKSEMRASGDEWENESDKDYAYVVSLTEKLREKSFPEGEAFYHIRIHHCGKFDFNELRLAVSSVYAESEPDDRKEPKSRGEIVSENMNKMILYLNKHYIYRMNRLYKCMEYHPNNSIETEFKLLDKTATNKMAVEVALEGIDVSEKNVRTYLYSGVFQSYNPITEYLYDCKGKWDGTDHIGKLAKTVSTLNPNWERWFRIWFRAMVLQWLGTGDRRYGNSLVPLLVSPQGYNKSTFCRSLLPEELLKWGYTDSMLFSDKRLVKQSLAHKLLINLDEFNQISPKEQTGFLKNIIQLASVKFRPPYGVTEEDFPRLASFIATSNVVDLLADYTGNRRFIVGELTKPIDITVRPNHRQLFAQALEEIRNGEVCYLDDEETKTLIEHNKRYVMLTPAQELFDIYFEIVEDEADGEYMSSSEILSAIKKKAGSIVKETTVNALGRYLYNMKGLKKSRRNNVYCYLVRVKG